MTTRFEQEKREKKNTSMAQIHNLFGTCERFSETLKTETCIHILTCDGHNWALSYLVYFSYLNNFYFIIWFYFKIIRSIQCVQSWVVNLFTRALRIYMRECVYMKIAKTREEKKINERTENKTAAIMIVIGIIGLKSKIKSDEMLWRICHFKKEPAIMTNRGWNLYTKAQKWVR